MRHLNLSACIRRQRYCSYKGVQGKIAKNHLKCQFDADRPNQGWLTDITEFKVNDCKLYLPPVLDCYNNEIISYTLSKRPTYDLVSEMLDKALDKIDMHQKNGVMLHSDQGSHYLIK